MQKPSRYEEVFIESLMKPLRIRILPPEEMELLGSIPERDRTGELVLQGVYDCDEFMVKLSATIGSELVSMMVDARTRPLLSRSRRIKADLLEATYRVNRLRWVQIRNAEEIFVDNRLFPFRIDACGRLVVTENSGPDPDHDGNSL